MYNVLLYTYSKSRQSSVTCVCGCFIALVHIMHTGRHAVRGLTVELNHEILSGSARKKIIHRVRPIGVFIFWNKKFFKNKTRTTAVNRSCAFGLQGQVSRTSLRRARRAYKSVTVTSCKTRVHHLRLIFRTFFYFSRINVKCEFCRKLWHKCTNIMTA